MNGKTFVDSNVLIYAHDLDVPAKREIADRVLRELWERHTGILSVQVLQEFYVNATRKIPQPLTKEVARLVVDDYSRWCTETTPAEISTAFRIEDESQINFWDALIVSSALKSGAFRLVSEDFQHGRQFGSLRVENPFL
jgi:predicted nucleic acid-binding protein